MACLFALAPMPFGNSDAETDRLASVGRDGRDRAYPVSQNGRIIVLFARREYPARGGRGILGVVSDDLDETWSKEFILRGDAYTWDCGYPVMTEFFCRLLFHKQGR